MSIAGINISNFHFGQQLALWGVNLCMTSVVMIVAGFAILYFIRDVLLAEGKRSNGSYGWLDDMDLVKKLKRRKDDYPVIANYIESVVKQGRRLTNIEADFLVRDTNDLVEKNEFADEESCLYGNDISIKD